MDGLRKRREEKREEAGQTESRTGQEKTEEIKRLTGCEKKSSSTVEYSAVECCTVGQR